MRYRSVEIDGETWRYGVGRSVVIARHEDGRSFQDPLHVVKGLDPEVFEKGSYKGSEDGMIKPGKVKAWLTRRIKNDSSKWQTR
jgi:hypothetical protein